VSKLKGSSQFDEMCPYAPFQVESVSLFFPLLFVFLGILPQC
jgi:hypothetical protein